MWFLAGVRTCGCPIFSALNPDNLWTALDIEFKFGTPVPHALSFVTIFMQIGAQTEIFWYFEFFEKTPNYL